MDMTGTRSISVERRGDGRIGDSDESARATDTCRSGSAAGRVPPARASRSSTFLSPPISRKAQAEVLTIAKPSRRAAPRPNPLELVGPSGA